MTSPFYCSVSNPSCERVRGEILLFLQIRISPLRELPPTAPTSNSRRRLARHDDEPARARRQLQQQPQGPGERDGRAAHCDREPRCCRLCKPACGATVAASATVSLFDSKSWAKAQWLRNGAPIYPTAAQIASEVQASTPVRSQVAAVPGGGAGRSVSVTAGPQAVRGRVRDARVRDVKRGGACACGVGRRGLNSLTFL